MGGIAAAFGLRVGARDAAATVAVSVLGALLGGFLASVLLDLEALTFNPPSVLAAAIGAVLLIGLLRVYPEAEPFA